MRQVSLNMCHKIFRRLKMTDKVFRQTKTVLDTYTTKLQYPAFKQEQHNIISMQMQLWFVFVWLESYWPYKTDQWPGAYSQVLFEQYNCKWVKSVVYNTYHIDICQVKPSMITVQNSLRLTKSSFVKECCLTNVTFGRQMLTLFHSELWYESDHSWWSSQ